jgi:hypothetical protein
MFGSMRMMMLYGRFPDPAVVPKRQRREMQQPGSTGQEWEDKGFL